MFYPEQQVRAVPVATIPEAVYFEADYSAIVSPVEGLEAVTSTTTVKIIDNATESRIAPPYALPVDWDLVDQYVWTRPHHDYPAIDIVVPVGTPVFAVREGLITTATPSDGNCGGSVGIKTDVGNLFYCHLSQVVVRYGDPVAAGQLVGYSGGKPGARGAGDSTTPHVHLQVSRSGRLWCPQPLLISILNAEEPNLVNTTRCVG